MRVIRPSFEILTPLNEESILRHLERVARTCYQSEGTITQNGESARRLLASIIKMGHESVLEHGLLTVRFIVDRAIANQIVRHRLASYAQESTRYCNYTQEKFQKEITVIHPVIWSDHSLEYQIWERAALQAEDAYFQLISKGVSPEMARGVLPLALKTTLVMTANYREWRYFLKLRSSSTVHPQLREVVLPLSKYLAEKVPLLFNLEKIP